MKPVEVMKWVQRGRSYATKDTVCNWPVLASYIGNLVVANKNPEWAEIGIYLYEDMASESENLEYRDSLILSAMKLRATVLAHSGDHIDTGLFSFQVLINWFFGKTPVSLAQVADLSEGWTHLPIEKIKALRKIKNDLKVFEILKDSEYVHTSSEMQEWLKIRAQLP